MSDKNFQILQGNVVQKMKGGTVIFNADKSTLYTLNETASYMFRSLKLGKNSDEISEQLARRYSITQSQAKKDTLSFINNLIKHNIIE